MPRSIQSPDDPQLAELCDQLREQADRLDLADAWPGEQLKRCADYGVFRWFLPREYGGLDWNPTDRLRGYLALSSACLTTTFVITQRTGACNRIASSDNLSARDRLLPRLAAGDLFATIGISHLTTSGQHLRRPLARAYPHAEGYRLQGTCPWVTGAAHADYLVVGAAVMDGEQKTGEELLALVPAERPGVAAEPAAALTGLSASCTGPLRLENVEIDANDLLAGPVEKVMTHRSTGTTGGLQTSTLALGLSQAAIGLIAKEAPHRVDLRRSLESLQRDYEATVESLFAAAEGDPACTKEELRTRANSLALRSTQAALAAAKGAGYVLGHPAGRWCREALFFLVWSCPQPVLAANLCELAGILE